MGKEFWRISSNLWGNGKPDISTRIAASGENAELCCKRGNALNRTKGVSVCPESKLKVEVYKNILVLRLSIIAESSLCCKTFGDICI